MGRAWAQEFLLLPLAGLGRAWAFGSLPEVWGSRVPGEATARLWSPEPGASGRGLGAPGCSRGQRGFCRRSCARVLDAGPRRLRVWGEAVAAWSCLAGSKGHVGARGLEQEGVAGLGISRGPSGGPKGQEFSLLPQRAAESSRPGPLVSASQALPRPWVPLHTRDACRCLVPPSVPLDPCGPCGAELQPFPC